MRLFIISTILVKVAAGIKDSLAGRISDPVPRLETSARNPAGNQRGDIPARRVETWGLVISLAVLMENFILKLEGPDLIRKGGSQGQLIRLG
jgi:hypothetical protein